MAPVRLSPVKRVLLGMAMCYAGSLMLLAYAVPRFLTIVDCNGTVQQQAVWTLFWLITFGWAAVAAYEVHHARNITGIK